MDELEMEQISRYPIKFILEYIIQQRKFNNMQWRNFFLSALKRVKINKYL